MKNLTKLTQYIRFAAKSLLSEPARIGSLFAFGFVTTTLVAVAVTGTIKTWTASEVLKASDLNTTIQSLQTAIEGIPNWTKGSSSVAYYTAGNVGIGTSSPARALVVSAGVSKLNNTGGVLFTGSGGGLLMGTDQNTGYIGATNQAGDTANVLAINGEGGNVAIGTFSASQKLTVNGNAGNTTGVWVNNSDLRLKKNIEPLSPYLDRLITLRPVTFEWKDPAKLGASEGKHIGFIAQEVEKVFPNWVDTDKTGYKWLNLEGVNAAFVKALQELSDREKANEKKLADLMEKNEKLSATNEELRLRLERMESAISLLERDSLDKMARK